jgi:hypothetical protein
MNQFVFFLMVAVEFHFLLRVDGLISGSLPPIVCWLYAFLLGPALLTYWGHRAFC